ncbi:dynamin family protein [Salibacterium sp. K-3]
MPELQIKNKDSLRDLPFYEEDEKRLLALSAKHQAPCFEAAFCGHFSAGKSTLLNKLSGIELLPSSPIPTSANIISIQYGKAGLAVTTGEGKRMTWDEEIPWDQVKDWGMQGEEIKNIDIFVPLPFLNESTRIFDTPGVDSTDPAHQLITTDQLYTADCIIYVTDYNHVQSETNLRFLKEMSEENKPIILVVNQIDKHNEAEVSLTSFKNGLYSTLSRSGIEPVELFFTSMKDEYHPCNEFDRFSSFLKPILFHGRELADDSMPMLEQGAVNRLIERLKEEKMEAYEQWKEETAERGIAPEDAEQSDMMEEASYRLEQERKEAVQSLYDERNQLFKNVTLFPYTTTEKVRYWLESCHPQFKKGWLFSRKKTEEERAQRKAAVLEELNEKVKTELLFHLKNMLLGSDLNHASNPEQFEKNVQELDFSVDEDILDRFAPTSEFDRSFVYTFTEKTADAIGRQLKSNSESLFQEYEHAINHRFEQEASLLEQKQQQEKELQEEYRKWKEKAGLFDRKIEECRFFLENTEDGPDFRKRLRETAEKAIPEGSIPEIAVSEQTESILSIPDEPDHETLVSVPDMDDSFVEPLRRYLQQYQDRPLFEQEKKKLARLLDQYDNNTVTVSLFGAFSAGKSSFINAMLGEAVLPASPHPTTAAVNRIKKSTPEYSHGTVLLEIKDESILEQEIQAVSRELGTELDLKTIQSWKKPDRNRLNAYQRTYADYLFTLQQSLKKRTAQPGTLLETGLEELHWWVGNEQYACLIQEAVIYYDCSWTEKGLVLVDTPGVHSVHGRHTNVAFQQLIHSHAVLYVTYYNHAFSKADHLFLQQMAGVNEQFDTNRLYFILNASDLADSKAELDGVKHYVKEQLRVNGVENPDLFCLSSKKALETRQNGAKTATDEAFSAFEHYFETITMDTLKADHLDRLYQFGTHIYRLLQSILADFEENGENLEETMRERLQLVEEFRQQMTFISFDGLLPSLHNELQQQCSYLQERVKLMIQDYFPQSVNPAVLDASTKREQKSRLQSALQEMEGLARTYLEQEIQTIIFRLQEQSQKYIQKRIRHFMDNNRPPALTIEAPDPETIQDAAGAGDMKSSLSIRNDNFLDYYQSGKDFFGKGRVQELKEDYAETVRTEAAKDVKWFEDWMHQLLIRYLQEQEEKTETFFEQETEREKERIHWLFDPSKQPALYEEAVSLNDLVQ